MATLPITADAQGAATATQLPVSLPGAGLFKNMGLLMAMAAAIGISVAVLLWMQTPDYRPVLGDMKNVSATEAVDVLTTNNIPFKLDPRSGALMVPAEHVHQARMQLAAVGISDNPSVGFELLDKEQGLGTSQFMENISYRRGLEGELARTVASLNSVKAARVHLALPKATVFVRDARKPSASVFVELMPGRSLREGQVAAIVNLVASSVPQMDSSDVSIVDQNGRLLSSQGESESATVAAYQFDYTRKLEDVLSKRVYSILGPVVGLDNFKAQVAADVDFTAVEQTEEAYNPDNSVLRSEQTMDEQRGPGATVGGVPGAVANQPPGPAVAPEQADGAADAQAARQGNNRNQGNSRSQATRNFELDRTISYTRHQQGKLSRLSVAVVVDHRPAAAPPAVEENADDANADAATPAGPTTEPWSQAELDQLSELVKGAIGFDAERGDVVTVISAAFTPVEVAEIPVEELPIWEQDFFQKMLKQGLAVLIVLILIFAVIRPIMKSITRANEAERELALAAATAQAEAAKAEAEGAAAATDAAGAMAPQIAAPDMGTPMLPGPGQEYGQQLSSVQMMMGDNPQRAAQVVKQWVTVDE